MTRLLIIVSICSLLGATAARTAPNDISEGVAKFFQNADRNSGGTGGQ